MSMDIKFSKLPSSVKAKVTGTYEVPVYDTQVDAHEGNPSGYKTYKVYALYVCNNKLDLTNLLKVKGGWMCSLNSTDIHLLRSKLIDADIEFSIY